MIVTGKRNRICTALAVCLLLSGCGKTTAAEPSQAAAEAVTSPQTEKVTAAESELPEGYETFYGVLIDEDCSDTDEPELHELPCMLMESCRASGYGLDILQDDGSWKFVMFDENGQQTAWDYLNQTERMDGLFVTVTGRLENGVIIVESLEES